eukprot:COSAG02_NODE_6420_length_3584_cov_12.288666_3_plen_161_part_00
MECLEFTLYVDRSDEDSHPRRAFQMNHPLSYRHRLRLRSCHKACNVSACRLKTARELEGRLNTWHVPRYGTSMPRPDCYPYYAAPHTPQSVWRRSVLDCVPKCPRLGAKVSGFRAVCRVSGCEMFDFARNFAWSGPYSLDDIWTKWGHYHRPSTNGKQFA